MTAKSRSLNVQYYNALDRKYDILFWLVVEVAACIADEGTTVELKDTPKESDRICGMAF